MKNLTQQLKQSLRISPQQIQLLNFLQLNTLELEATIKSELDENPFLEGENSEGDAPVIKSEEEDARQALHDFMSYPDLIDDDTFHSCNQHNTIWEQMPIKQPLPWYTDVLEQLACLRLPALQSQICEFILFSLDDAGFCSQSLSDLTDDLSFALNKYLDEATIEACLRIVQRLEPIGLASRDVQSFLLFQLSYDSDEMAVAARQVVQKHFHELVHHQYGKIMQANGWQEIDFLPILRKIQNLRPRPICGHENTIESSQIIQPDFILSFVGDSIEVRLNNANLPKIQFNQNYLSKLQNRVDKTTQQFIQSKISTGKWLIEAIQQREQTMLKVIKCLITAQEAFFRTGDFSQLKPMVLREIAETIQMDISTVSRVTSGKFAQTPFGLIHLKDLFSERIITIEGQDVSNKAIQHLILSLIAQENKQMPLNDAQLTDIIKANGCIIARRTVAKYREMLGLPSATERKIACLF